MALNILVVFNTSKLTLSEYGTFYSKLITLLCKDYNFFQRPSIDFANERIDLEQKGLEHLPNALLQRESLFNTGIAYINPEPNDTELGMHSYSPTGYSHTIALTDQSTEDSQLSFISTPDGSNSRLSIEYNYTPERSVLIDMMAALIQLLNASAASAINSEFRAFARENTNIPYGSVGWITFCRNTKQLPDGVNIIKTIDNESAIVSISDSAPAANDKTALEKYVALSHCV